MASIIGLTGFAGAGKDAVGALLRMRNYQRIAFGDGVKEEVLECITSRTYYLDPDMPKALWLALHPDAERPLTAEEVFAKPTSPEMRKVLQLWGTEFRRSQDPMYWIKRALAKRTNLGKWVFTDVRFPGEAQAIKYIGGEIWRIDRPGLSSDGHASENGVTFIHPDRVIFNNLGLWELAGQVAVWAS